MSNYPMSLLRRVRGGGLIEDDPLVLTETDFSGNPYVATDYEGSYLVDLKLRDVSTWLRVNRWKVAVTIDVTLGGTSNTYTSSTITTPSTVYEIARGDFTESAPGSISWSSSLYEVPDENYHELNKGTGSARSRPFRELRLDCEVATDQVWDLIIRPMRGYQSFDYYMQSLPNLETALKVKPTDSIYMPFEVELEYFDDKNFSSAIRLQVFSKISDSNLDWDKADLTKQTDAISLKYLGVDTTFDAYWGELNGESITIDNLSIDIEAAEYWTYGGRFDSTTGKTV